MRRILGQAKTIVNKVRDAAIDRFISVCIWKMTRSPYDPERRMRFQKLIAWAHKRHSKEWIERKEAEFIA